MDERIVHLMCDLQFGSTGKGLLAGFLAKKYKYDTVVTAWGANAGHTYIDESGRKFVHTMLANGIVSPSLRTVLIGPGSMINPDNLAKEIKDCTDLLENVTIAIHPNAGVITQNHRDIEEATMTGIGSTKKGVGAALMEKIQRSPDKIGVIGRMEKKDLPEVVFNSIVTREEYNDLVDASDRILIEGAQGFSLSIQHGLYPYVTSRDVTPAQICADTCIPIKDVTRIFGVARTYPIRVANRYDEDGNMIGYSGPGYPDQEEINWNDIGVVPEYTTVTKLERRVFTFSYQQIAEAIRACQPDEIFLNFANYATPGILMGISNEINFACSVYYPESEGVTMWGWGPKDSDITTKEQLEFPPK